MVLRRFVPLGIAALALGCAGCSLLTEALRGVGIPVGSGATEAARAVDLALGGWLFDLFGLRDFAVAATTVALTEGGRATHRVVKKRRAKKAAQVPDPRA